MMITSARIAWSVSAALYHREQTGKGQKIETTLLGSALAIQTSSFQLIESADLEWKQQVIENLTEQRAEGADYEAQKQARLDIRPIRTVAMYYRAYKTKDNYIVVGALSAALRKKFCDAMGFEVNSKAPRDPAVVSRIIGIEFIEKPSP